MLNGLLSKISVNWKTSLTGLGMILSAVGDIAHSVGAGTHISWHADLMSIAMGLGLLAAKDSNVTGGTKAQDGATPNTPTPTSSSPSNFPGTR